MLSNNRENKEMRKIKEERIHERAGTVPATVKELTAWTVERAVEWEVLFVERTAEEEVLLHVSEDWARKVSGGAVPAVQM